MLHDTGKITSTALNQRIRKEEGAAYDRLAAKMTVTKLTTAQELEWYDVFKQAHARLAAGARAGLHILGTVVAGGAGRVRRGRC